MKKLISTLMCLSVITGMLPISAGAVSEPIYINDNPESWTKTVYMGDTNDDGKISVADAVQLRKNLFSGESGTNLDINYDGVVDSFDMVIMKKLILNPESAETKTYAIDVIKSVTDTSENGCLITDLAQLDEYLSSVLSDSAEIEKYLEKYNESFFEENNLFLEQFVQKRGNGVFSTIEADGAVNINKPVWSDEPFSFNGIIASISTEYEYDEGLYPITNTDMLAQITLPKYATKSGMQTGIFNGLFDDTPSSNSYISPDGETELYIVQSSFLLGGSIDLYFKNKDGSFNYITYLSTDDGCNPFSDYGEWFTDSNGNDVFGDRENYTITWTDGGFVIDHDVDNVWEKTVVTKDGDISERSFYEYSYKKWCEEDYENGDYSHVYSSPDGEHSIRVTQSKNDYYGLLNIGFSFKGSDGSIKNGGGGACSGYRYGEYNSLVYPFDKNLTEWTKDENGNDVISNISEKTGSPTFKLTWKENSVDVEYITTATGGWSKSTINFE